MNGQSNPSFVFTPAEIPSLAVAGSTARFPVGAIYAFTGTYGTNRSEPAVFTKGSRTVADSGATLPYPAMTAMLEPEIELVVAIGQEARNLADDRAARAAVFGYGVGLDMTRRDLQRAARNEGKPWDMAKTFDVASPIGAIQPAERVGHPQQGAITLDVNGRRAQEGDLLQMAWTPLALVAMLSRFVTLRPGDVIFTGTPSGEILLHPGDRLDGHITGLGHLLLTIG